MRVIIDPCQVRSGAKVKLGILRNLKVPSINVSKLSGVYGRVIRVCYIWLDMIRKSPDKYGLARARPCS